MRKAWHILSRATVLLLAAVWLQTAAHTAVCHSDNAMCGHDGCAESTVCTCLCHAAIETPPEAPVFIEHRETVWVPASNEHMRALLLPDDIFRPPLTNS